MCIIAPYTPLKSSNSILEVYNPPLSSNTAVSSTQKTTSDSSLGSNTKSQSKPKTRGLERNQSLRRSRFKLKNTSADLIKTLPLKNRVEQCNNCRANHEHNVKIKHNGKKGSKGKASFTNLMQCDNVWLCPVCASRIMAKRGSEVAQGAEAWTSAGGHIIMMTNTLRHSADDNLADLLKGLKKATASFWGHRVIKRIFSDLGKVGHIKNLEATHGSNGFHPHNHYAIFIKSSMQELGEYDVSYYLDDDNLVCYVSPYVEKQLEKEGRIDDIKTCSLTKFLSLFWIRCCVKNGLKRPTVENGLKIQDADNIKSYLTKIDSDSVGLGHELTNAESKNSCDQYDLLRMYQEGDKKAGKLFQTFALAIKGERALSWSRGLKDLLGIDDIADSEIEEDTSEDIAEITPEIWHLIVRYRLHCKVLETAELDYKNGTNELSKKLSILAERVAQERQKRSGQLSFEEWSSTLPPL